MMIKRLLVFILFPLLLATACSAATSEPETVVADKTERVIEVFRAPTWGCCGDWIAYIAENGFTVEVHDTQDLTAVKSQYKVPHTLQSCHTAIVDGYVLEGHVPVTEIERLLRERPEILGLAVPGMPVGSPGMEMSGVAPHAYDVVAFDAAGNTEIFASYNQ